MDHSMQGYLSRRTTEELEIILQHCLQEENSEHYAHIAFMIRKILKQRKHPSLQ
jgi:hypothetical protein